MAEVSVVVGSHPLLGDILTDGEGRTLYLLTADPPGESVCTGGCAEAWPPLTVERETGFEAGPAVTASLGTIERDDGSQQVTADGTPLYYWANDDAPGDATGQEFNNVWFVLRPDASPVKPTVSVRQHDELGPILTDADGLTLYLFTNDEGETSNCTGGCVDAWPPLTVAGEDALVDSVRTDVTLGTTEHPEVGTMVTAAGHPLYYYAQDEAPGDANGQGFGDVWYVLDPTGSPVDGAEETRTTVPLY
jgi:predicted lipoprotein with Yx(FWY)xxD motif